jgi:hypothetical protein
VAAEGIHLSVLDDVRASLDGEIQRHLKIYREHARVGAILVDFPYFDHFELEMMRYALKRPPGRSHWGDRFHRHAPAGWGLQMLRQARHENDAALLAMALGHLTHVAVDWELHPMVNKMAHERLAVRGLHASGIDDPLHMHEHREIEKFQSVLFHERRLGIDVMGNPAIERLIRVEALACFSDDDLARGIERSARDAVGIAPSRAEWSRWAAGYTRYVKVLASPLGRIPAPRAARLRERAQVFESVQFEQMFARAVERARRYVTAGYAAFEAGRFDGRFFAAVPEGSIDDGGN